jgi:hypothetical protein
LNSYQLQDVSLGEVAAQVGVPVDAAREVILSVSPCRNGTTVLLRVFGAAGVPAYYQPLKNVLRWQMQGEVRPWSLPAGGRVYLKETLGPYTLLEAGFNPLAALLEAGLPRERLRVFVAGRAPLNAWASWFGWWGQVTTTGIFQQAYETVEAIRRQALALGIPTAVFLYEAIRDNGCELAVERLFNWAGIPYAVNAVRGWLALPPFGSEGSNIFLPDEPPVFDVPGLHDKVETANALGYFARSRDRLALREADVAQLRAGGVARIYEAWRQECQRGLGLYVAADEDLA